MKNRIWLLTLLLTLLLSGCAVPTVDQLYAVPARPESYSALQSVFDGAMKGLDYASPRNGENLQTVQMADLDGDGIREYLIFARSDADKSLRILIFAPIGTRYVLVDTVPCSGTSFDQVEYAQMDGKGGVELLVGTRISEQVYRSAVVYTYLGGKTHQILSTSYVRYLTGDLDADGLAELLVLKPGITDEDYGTAAAFRVEEGVGRRSNEVPLSCPVDKINRVETGALSDGMDAVFISGEDASAGIVTDVLALDRGQLRNAALEAAPSGENRLYPADMDGDGILELPAVEKIRDPNGALNQQLIRWYTLDSRGTVTDRLFAYQDDTDTWCLTLAESWLPALRISRDADSVSFYQEDSETGEVIKIFTVYALTGQNREANAVIENRFILHKGQQVIYVARLEVASGALSITQEDLIRNFRLLDQA